MRDAGIDFLTAIFAKTSQGSQEIRDRTMGLAPMLRRALILVDGKRNGAELAPFLAGQDLSGLMHELLQLQCIEVVSSAPPAPPESKKKTPEADLPEVSVRTAKDLEMARNFMINTVNTMFGRNMRLSLVESIFNCTTSEDLRKVYPAWQAAMQADATGSKRLGEFRKSLFQYL